MNTNKKLSLGQEKNNLNKQEFDNIKKVDNNDLYGTYYTKKDGGEEIIINNKGVYLDDNKNEIIEAQLENSKAEYNSLNIQFILYFVTTLILIGFVISINASGNLSIFLVIVLLILLFVIFKFLRFNIVNFILNFKI